MVVYCCAYGCKNERVPGKNIRFHKFPLLRPAVLELWIRALCFENFKPNAHTVICSEHFTADCYLESSLNKKLLKKDGVPSIFNFPQHLMKKPKSTRRESKRNCIEMVNNVSHVGLEVPEGASISLTTRDISIQTSPQLLRNSLPQLKMYKRKIKTLQQKVSRKQAKIARMKDLI